MRTLLRTQRRDRGSMLVIALGVLALLSLLAITFVSLMKLELLASKNYVDGVKSRLIAEGGMEEAITELKSRGGLDGISNINDDWVYANGDYSYPLEQAKARNGVALQGADRLLRTSYDGNLGSTYAKKGDRYKIEVIDTQCQFNLNNVFDGQTLDPTLRETNIYTRELRCLGEAIRQLDPRAKGVDPVARAAYPRNAPRYFGAEAFYAYRQTLDGRQFNSKYQLNEILASEQDYIVLRPYVTTKSWVDPNTVVAAAHDIGSLRNNVFFPKEPWTDVIRPVPANASDLPFQRAPINVNLASIPVLTANLAGLAGRATFYYYGDRSKPSIFQTIDKDTKYAFSGSAGITVQEELEYTVTPVNVYFAPMGYKPGATGVTGGGAIAPPFIDGARKIAELIDQRRRSLPSTGTVSGVPTIQGPFKSYADWERWVDANIADSVLADPKLGFPQPGSATVLNIDDSPLVGTPTAGDIIAHPRFRQWFFDSLRSILKANMNPNARTSMLNPSAAAAVEVDKGNILYFTNPSQPTTTKFNCQTCEWCFGSKGIFEIISLGEVLGADPKVADKLDEQNPIAQSKILTVIQIFDQVSHTSQRDFERNGDPAHNWQRPLSASGTGGGYGGFGDDKKGAYWDLPPGNQLRFGMVSYPYPKQLWDPRVGGWAGRPSPSDPERYIALMTGGPDDGWHAHDYEGHLELAPRMTLKGRPNDTSVVSFGNALFELLFQDRHVRTPGDLTNQTPADSFIADTTNKAPYNVNPGPGCPNEGDPPWAYAFPHPARAPGVAPNQTNPNWAIYAGATGGVYSGVDERKLGFIYNLLMEPDGFYTNELRNLPLSYRASDKNSLYPKGGGPSWPPKDTGPEAGQGESIPNVQYAPAGGAFAGGNCMCTPKGGFEMWYKPDFDWFVRQKGFSPPADPGINFVQGGGGGNLPDERFCGLIVTCHNVVNQTVTHWEKPDNQPRATCGVEFHLIRDTSGDLRATRIFFEVCGESDSTGNYDLPWVSDIRSPGPGGPDPAKPIALGRIGVSGTYMDKATTQPEYTWPPFEFQVIPPPWHDIKFARVDTWVPASYMQQWRAHEWHHIAVQWDDTTGTLQAGNSIQIYLDGVGPPAVPTITRQIGPHYSAIDNNPQTPVAPPTPQNPNVLTPNKHDEAAFCRLNEDPRGEKDPVTGSYSYETRYPRDHIQIGGVMRKQYTQGGLYKFKQTVLMPANGTVDDVRFYDGVSQPQAGKTGVPDRYEQKGIWTNEFDLSSRFSPGNDLLDLANIQFTAYLPTYFAGARPAGGRGGAGNVRVSFKLVHADGSEVFYTAVPAQNFDGWSRDFMDNSGLAGFKLTEPSGQPVVAQRSDRLVYTIEMFPACIQIGSTTLGDDGFAVATPVLDDVTLVYFLPTPRVLIKERMWD